MLLDIARSRFSCIRTHLKSIVEISNDVLGSSRSNNCQLSMLQSIARMLLNSRKLSIYLHEYASQKLFEDVWNSFRWSQERGIISLPFPAYHSELDGGDKQPTISSLPFSKASLPFLNLAYHLGFQPTISS